MAARQMSLVPRERRRSLLILGVGTLAALLCSLGPVWLTRIGLGIAILTAALSVWHSWRQLDHLVARHTAELKQVRHLARDAAHAHHVEMMTTLTRFRKRQEAQQALIAEARAQREALQTQLTAAQDDAEAKQARISSLNKRISDLEKELAAATDEVLNLPRRGASRRSLDVSRIPLVYPIEGQRRQA
ncbi:MULTISPECIES: hypothetical protein [unclassified Luteococcus]|uniref:hypothetical protein n=1 Tax=unclassified Luteococcus TaxID=2639923 RepID=UPI00313DAEE9